MPHVQRIERTAQRTSTTYRSTWHGQGAVHVIVIALVVAAPLVTPTREARVGKMSAIEVARGYGSSTSQLGSRGKPYNPDVPQTWWSRGGSSGARPSKPMNGNSTGYHPSRSKSFWKHFHTYSKPEKQRKPIDHEK
jgi:hypothetical protein